MRANFEQLIALSGRDTRCVAVIKCHNDFAHRSIGMLPSGTSRGGDTNHEVVGVETKSSDVKNSAFIEVHLHMSSVARYDVYVSNRTIAS